MEDIDDGKTKSAGCFFSIGDTKSVGVKNGTLHSWTHSIAVLINSETTKKRISANVYLVHKNQI
jgi:hypothetical protein